MPLPKSTIYSVQTILNQIFSDTDGSVSLSAKSASAIGHGRKTVTTAGTAVALGANTAIARITIVALGTNTGQIAIGGSGVVAASGATRTGVILEKGDRYDLAIDNLSKVYIDATTYGEGVSFTYTA